MTHDAARPNVVEDDILNLLQDIKESGSSCSYLYTPVYDSIKEIQTKDKDNFHLVQTPQISKFNDLKLSLKKCIDENIEWTTNQLEYAHEAVEIEEEMAVTYAQIAIPMAIQTMMWQHTYAEVEEKCKVAEDCFKNTM